MKPSVTFVLRSTILVLFAVVALACEPTDTGDASTDGDDLASTPATDTASTATPQRVSHALSHTGITRGLDGTPVAGEYTMKIQVGTPAQDFEVVMDSGSSNLILLGDPSICDNCTSEKGNQYDPSASNTSQMGETPIQIAYGSGQLDAVEVQDQVAIAGTTGFGYTFGVMTHDASVPNILGLAYEGIAEPQGAPLPTFFATWVEQTGMADLFSMKLCGPEKGGTVEFGGSSVTPTRYMPVVEEAWYVVAPDDLVVAGSGTSLGSFQGVRTIVDSGTTELAVTQEMFDGMVDAVDQAAQSAGITFEQIGEGNYGIVGDPGDLSSMPTLQVTAGDDAYDIAPSTYLKKVGQDRGETVYLFAVSIQANPILGQVFIENYYTVFDRENQRLGFAPIGDLCG